MADRIRASAAPYTIPDRTDPFANDSDAASERKKKRKYVDRKRRENTRRCVDELAGLVNEVGLVEEQSVSTILAATVAYIHKLETEVAEQRVAAPWNGSKGTESWVSLVEEKDDELKIVVDLNGNIVFTSASIHPLLGYSQQMLHQLPLHRLVHPDDRHFLAARLSPQRPANITVRLMTASGAAKIFFLNVRTVTDAGSGAKFVALVGKDHPLRFGLEQRLLPYSASHPEQWVTHHAPNGVFLRVSSNAEQMFGLATTDLLGKSPYVYYHVDDVARIMDSHSAVIRSANSKVVYRFWNSKVNKHVWVQTTSSLIIDDATGRPCAIICKTTPCDPLSVPVLAPALQSPDQIPLADTTPEVLRGLLDSLHEENSVLRDVLNQYASPRKSPSSTYQASPPLHPPQTRPPQPPQQQQQPPPPPPPQPRPPSKFSIDVLMK